MENASKALLIAGAILLVIALIAIGMAILNTGNKVVDDSTGSLNTLAVQSYNQSLTPYLDKEVKENSFNDLKSKLIAMGFDNPANIATTSWVNITGVGAAAATRVGIRANDYITVADAQAHTHHPVLGNVTNDDVGKIVSIQFYNMDNNNTLATWSVQGF